jgi:prevent-host-death family protein
MTILTYNVQEAKAQLYKLVQKVDSGREVIIAKAGKPMARISRIEKSRSKICFGVLKGMLKVFDDFDTPLPDHIVSEFEGNRCGS